MILKIKEKQKKLSNVEEQYNQERLYTEHLKEEKSTKIEKIIEKRTEVQKNIEKKAYREYKKHI